MRTTKRLMLACGLCASCGATELSDRTWLGPPRAAARPCAARLDAAPPVVPAQNIAILHVLCFEPEYCAARLRDEACAVGADVVYGVHDVLSPGRRTYPYEMAGTAARRVE